MVQMWRIVCKTILQNVRPSRCQMKLGLKSKHMIKVSPNFERHQYVFLIFWLRQAVSSASVCDCVCVCVCPWPQNRHFQSFNVFYGFELSCYLLSFPCEFPPSEISVGKHWVQMNTSDFNSCWHGPTQQPLLIGRDVGGVKLGWLQRLAQQDPLQSTAALRVSATPRIDIIWLWPSCLWPSCWTHLHERL